MATIQISFEVPEDLMKALNTDRDELTMQTRLYAALQLFRTHKLSLGKAAEFAGLSREKFKTALNDHKIAMIDYPATDLEGEMERFES